jgi:hypothetical protein
MVCEKSPFRSRVVGTRDVSFDQASTGNKIAGGTEN